MPKRIFGTLGVMAIVGSLAVSSLHSQTRQAAGRGQPSTTAPPKQKATAIHDLSKLSAEDKQLYMSAKRGVSWLARMNRPGGRFVYGLKPDLGTISDDDHYIHQVGAAFALARAGRFFQDKQATALARQTLLTLLLQTGQDKTNPRIRRPLAALSAANELAAAGWLVMAIHELPNPGNDLLQKSEQLCRFLLAKQRQDGSLACSANATETLAVEAVNSCTGPALYGISLSLRHGQVADKLAFLRKALRYYHPWWRSHKSTTLVPFHSAAYAEAYLRTKDQAFANGVWEMNDWICTLQYKKLHPTQLLWLGGFKTWSAGQVLLTAPDVHAALQMEGLTAACRVARRTGDVRRYQRYRRASEACGHFLMKLQYTSANTQHFAPWYRTRLLGGFHPSPGSGDLRIDYTQQAVCGMIQHLTHSEKEFVVRSSPWLGATGGEK